MIIYGRNLTHKKYLPKKVKSMMNQPVSTTDKIENPINEKRVNINFYSLKKQQ